MYMPNMTSNYNLTKPFKSEKVNVDTINSNMDSVDSKLKSLSDSIDSNSKNIGDEIIRAKSAEQDIIETINNNKANWEDKYTKSEIDNKFSTLETNIDWKEAVSTFDDISTVYPSPIDGWTVNVKDTDLTYRYNGIEWVAISSNAIPKATEELDGLMSKEDKKAIDNLRNTYLGINANAISATKATQDGNGNVIADTYANKTDLPTKVSELENDKGYTAYSNRFYTLSGDYIDTQLSNIGISLDLTFIEVMNLIKNNLVFKGETASVSLVLNSNESAFNKSLPFYTGGILVIYNPKQNRRFFELYNFRNGDIYKNYEIDGTYGSWAKIANTDSVSLNGLGLTATATELNYCDGVTSNIQTQLNGKANSSHGHNNLLPTSTSTATYTTLADFWTYCDSVIKSLSSRMMVGRAKLTTFAPVDGWYRYIVSQQNNLGNGQCKVTGSIILDNGRELFYGKVTGGVTNASDLSVEWTTLGGNAYCGATVYSTSEPTTYTKGLVWIG